MRAAPATAHRYRRGRTARPRHPCVPSPGGSAGSRADAGGDGGGDAREATPLASSSVPPAHAPAHRHRPRPSPRTRRPAPALRATPVPRPQTPASSRPACRLPHRRSPWRSASRSPPDDPLRARAPDNIEDNDHVRERQRMAELPSEQRRARVQVRLEHRHQAPVGERTAACNVAAISVG